MIVTIVRKPYDHSTTQNTKTYGCGGINIDGTRIGDDLRFNQPSGTDNKCYNTTWVGTQTVGTYCSGRWPANVVLSESSLPHLPQATQGHWANAKVTGYGDVIGSGSVEYFGVGEKDQTGGTVAKYFLIIQGE